MNEVKNKTKKARDNESKSSILASERRVNKKQKGAIIALSITAGVLTLSTIGLAIGLGVEGNKAMTYRAQLENIHNDNFYNLLDSVNNLETKLSKTLSATEGSDVYQRKMLLEASKNASESEISIAQLPLSQGDIQEMVRLVNQISGYTSTLAEKLAQGGSLSTDEISTLKNVHDSVLKLKAQLNEFEKRLQEGYSILDSSMSDDVGTNEFTRSLSNLKNNDIEYPTMIYDGPFSDSVVNSKVKGLNGSAVTKEQAHENIGKYFKNVATITFENETNGKFETYNFRVKNSDDETLFVQVSKIGGYILTVSGAGRDGSADIDKESAMDIAIKFALENGVEDAQVVWSDTIKNDIYLNIAPKKDGIILYPDLVKVKVNMTSGTVVGYDATTYFTNHTSRQLSKGILSLSDAKGKVPSTYELVDAKLVLAPLDYNREVVCVEVEADYQNDTYYFYFNAEDGTLENVLKVIKTDNGNLLL